MTIRVYGDSFGEDDHDLSWPRQVSTKMQLPIVNHALGGSSTEYSFKLFIDDVNNSTFRSGDIMIFITSTPGRLFFQHQMSHAPREAGMVFNAPDSYEWYWSNVKHIRWYLRNIDWKVLQLNHEAYISAIKDVARHYQDCLFIVMSNSYSGQDFNVNTDPSNFLRSRTYLLEVSRREIHDGNIEKFYNAHPDPRINHLCLPNLNTLSDLMIQAIQQRDISCITYDRFRSDLFDVVNTRKYYKDLVDQGILAWRDWWYQRLEK